jgi:hypothetical protein
MAVTDGIRLVVKMYDYYVGFEMTGGAGGAGTGKDSTGWDGALIEVYAYCAAFCLAWFGAKHLDTQLLMAYLVSGGCCFLTALLVSYGVIQEFVLDVPIAYTPGTPQYDACVASPECDDHQLNGHMRHPLNGELPAVCGSIH